MARIVRLDEHRRRRIRRRRWLKDIDTRLRRLESSVVVLHAEEVAGELVTVGRQLVRVLQDFDAEWHGQSGAGADGSGEMTQDVPALPPPPQAVQACPDGSADLLEEGHGGDYGVVAEGEPAGYVGSCRTDSEARLRLVISRRENPEWPSSEEDPIRQVAGRPLSYPEYWQLIGTCLGELAGALEHLSARAVQHSLYLSRLETTTSLPAGLAWPQQPQSQQPTGEGPMGPQPAAPHPGPAGDSADGDT